MTVNRMRRMEEVEEEDAVDVEDRVGIMMGNRTTTGGNGRQMHGEPQGNLNKM